MKKMEDQVQRVNKALVSAIVITHNRCDLAKKAILSVFRQTYSPIEIIVVDDASESSARECLLEFLKAYDCQYIYIPKDESRGGNHARNVGAEASHGAYLAFLDDDDEWLETKIEKQVQFLDENQDIGMVHCAKIFAYDTGKIEKRNLTDVPRGDIRESVWVRVPFTTSCLMLRRELFERIGGFDEKLRFWQEYDLGVRLSSHSELGLVQEYLVIYRVNLADKHRLTNKVKEWEDAVAYFEKKHEKLLLSMPIEIQEKHKKRIYQDGLMRACNAGDMKEKRKYLKYLYDFDPTVKNKLKYILNVTHLNPLGGVNEPDNLINPFYWGGVAA